MSIKVTQCLQIFVLRHRALFTFLAATVVYSLLAVFYMGGAILNSTESLLAFPGDNTAGLIALFTLDSHDPWLGHTNFYSYPYGEPLGQPTHITAQVLFVPFWYIAKLVGPISAYNILCFIGFLSAALVMFGFMRWLLKGRIMLPLIAGFAVAFTPYLQIKTGVHISYAFEGFLISAIWLFLAYWKAPSRKKAVLLGLNVGLFAYIDGYFILLGGVLMVGLLGGSILYEYFAAGRSWSHPLSKRLKGLLVSGGVAILLVCPVLYVQFTASSQISGLLSALRDNIHNEAQVYGARPLEYILPNAENPITSPIFGNYEKRDSHGSNPAENMLSLSWVLLGAAVFFLWKVYTAKKHREKLSKLRFTPAFIAVVFGVMLLVAFLVSLPPRLGPLYMPSYALIEVIQLWRVLARLVIVVNIALVVLGVCGLVILFERFKRQWVRVILGLIILMLIFLEYLTFLPPRPVSGYEKVPQFYYWLRNQPQYDEIAEYPLQEFADSSYSVFYNTYQLIHKKKMLNGAVSESQPMFARQALSDLTSPQAVQGLRALGIDMVVIHAPTFPGKIEGLRLVHESAEAQIKTAGKPNKVWGYEVLPGKAATYVAAPVQGFHAPIVKSSIHKVQQMGHEGVIEFRKLRRGSADHSQLIMELELRAIDKKGQRIKIGQGNGTLWEGNIPPAEKVMELSINPNVPLVIRAVEPDDDATLWLSRISIEKE